MSLEAPSGWGKTRVVQEFYRWLSANRQSVPGYWPGTITEGVDGLELATPEGRRKRVFPQRWEGTGEVPSWFWWGIACQSRSGLPMQALAEDLGQLHTHSEALQVAWRRIASLGDRVQEAMRKHGLSGLKAATMELAGQVVPFLGLAEWLGGNAWR